MRPEFDSADLDRLETDADFTGGFGADVITGFRKVMQVIRAASDERTLYALRGFPFEKLDGKRQHQHSLRISKQSRLIVELRGKATDKRIGIITIEDFH
jgi:proteic killer suppression protein